MLPDFAKRISGSGDLFNKRGRKPWASINFITAHDGFNLNDLVSYNEKHNEANGEENRDGHSNNHSWNHGVEGPTDDRSHRRAAGAAKTKPSSDDAYFHSERRCCWRATNSATPSRATITLTLRTTTSTGRIGSGLRRSGRTLREFTRRLIATRKAFPILHRSRFLVGSRNEEMDVTDVHGFTSGG